MALCPLKHLTSKAMLLAPGLTVRERLRPGSLCRYTAQRIRGLQSARPYRSLRTYILQCLLGIKLPACRHCLQMKGIRYLPRTTPLRSAVCPLRYVKSVVQRVTLLTQPVSLSSPHAVRGAIDGANMWEVVSVSGVPFLETT